MNDDDDGKVNKESVVDDINSHERIENNKFNEDARKLQGISNGSIANNEEVKPKAKKFDFIKKKPKEDVQSIPVVAINNNENINKIDQVEAKPEHQLIPEQQVTQSTEGNTFNHNGDSPKSLISNEKPEITNPIVTPSVEQIHPISPNKTEKKFNFIKKKPTANKPDTTNTVISLPINQTNNSNEDNKQAETKPAKDPSIIINAPLVNYQKETKNNHLILHNQNENLKTILYNLTNIRNHISSETNIKRELEESINSLTIKQNNLIESNNFDEAIKVEEQIKQNTERIKETTTSIQIKTEHDLYNIKNEIVDVFRTKVQQFSQYTKSLNAIQKESIEAMDLLNQTDKVSLETLSSQINDKASNTDHLNLEYQEALQQIERTEGTYNNLYEEETADINNTINNLKKDHEDIENEIIELRRLLESKEASLLSIEKKIADYQIEKQVIRIKYDTDESYMKSIQSKNNKQNIYEVSLKELNGLKEKYDSLNQYYNGKINAITEIVNIIEHNTSVNLPINKQIEEYIQQMKENNESESHKRKHIHLNEKTIEEYALKINENNEKIEVLDLQNKRISNDILSLDSNIKNLEEVKKAHVTKKQFKDAQSITLEIKKFNEKKASLDELLDENNKEINAFKQENETQIKEAEMLKKKINDLNKEIEEMTIKYLELYLWILNQLKEDCGKGNENDSHNHLIMNEIDKVKEQIEHMTMRNETINPNEGIDAKYNDNPEEGEEIHKDQGINEEKEKEIEIAESPVEENDPKPAEEEIKEAEKSIEEIGKEINELEEKLSKAVEIEDYEEADKLNEKIESLKSKLPSSS